MKNTKNPRDKLSDYDLVTCKIYKKDAELLSRRLRQLAAAGDKKASVARLLDVALAAQDTPIAPSQLKTPEDYEMAAKLLEYYSETRPHQSSKTTEFVEQKMLGFPPDLIDRYVAAQDTNPRRKFRRKNPLQGYASRQQIAPTY